MNVLPANPLSFIPYGAVIIDNVPLIVAVSGLLTLIYSIVRAKTPKEATGRARGLEYGLGFASFVVGLFVPVAAALCFVNGVFGIFTIVLLLVLSGALVLGPISRIMKKIPALGGAAVIALILAYLAATFVTALIPPQIQTFLTHIGVSQWIFIALMVIVTLFLFVILLFARGLIEITGLILGAWPIMLIIGIVCIVQGILLFLGMSLTQFIEGPITVPW
jgi:hypothetical protein